MLMLVIALWGCTDSVRESELHLAFQLDALPTELSLLAICGMTQDLILSVSLC